MAILRSLLFYVLFYGFSAVLVVASVLAIPFGRHWLKRVVAIWGKWHRWCVTNLLGIAVVVEGTLPDEPVLIAVKHESYFEAIDMPRLLSFPAVFAKQELFAIPGWGFSAKVYGLIPVARDKGARALRQMITIAKARTEEGRPLVIFPEGTRMEHGESRTLQSGFAGLYKLLGLPVVPVAVNSGPLYHRVVKQSGTITYRIGETIPAGLPRQVVEQRVFEALNALNSEDKPVALATASATAGSDAICDRMSGGSH
ncbi:MAG: lysophospholipid acyltransferase family protein [Pseudomonadota bacterium]